MHWRRFLSHRGSKGHRQRGLPFLERRERLERRFKRAILLLTCLACAGVIAGTRSGRHVSRRFALEGRSVLLRGAGLASERAVIDARRRVERQREVEQTRRIHRQVYAEATPALRRLLDHAGLGPEDAVLRWGNYDKILLLPSKVFEADETGRAYRMRPRTRAVWVRRITLPRGLSGFFLMPDTPDLTSLVETVGASIVPNSSQTTNSWGCRGPEPELSAPLRGLILGDSNVQGIFLGEDETPVERLRLELQHRLATRVSLLNTGHLGYSPEQMYSTLLEYAPRFRPHFIVFSFCPNDFGDVFGPVVNASDLKEAEYWTGRILDECRSRGILTVATPVPYEHQVTSKRREGDYPGRICNLLPIGSLFYCNPIEDFVDEHLRLTLETQAAATASPPSPLFNGSIEDWHMSAIGAQVWGKSVGRRLALLLEGARTRGEVWFERNEHRSGSRFDTGEVRKRRCYHRSHQPTNDPGHERSVSLRRSKSS